LLQVESVGYQRGMITYIRDVVTCKICFAGFFIIFEHMISDSICLCKQLPQSTYMNSKSNKVGFKKKVRINAKKSKSKGRISNSKKKVLTVNPLRLKIGYTITTIICIILIVGSIGISHERPSRHIPETPPEITNGTVFFAPVPVPDNPLSLLFGAEINVTWDRSDIFLVVGDENKKEQCNNLPLFERISSTSTTCKSEDIGYEVVGLNNSTGLEWTVENGDYFFGIGTLGEIATDDPGLTLYVSIELKLSASGYFFLIPIATFGIVFIKLEHNRKSF